MDSRPRFRLTLMAALIAAFAGASAWAAAQTAAADTTASDSNAKAAHGESRQLRKADKHVDEAINVVHHMESVQGMDKLLQQAKGVFIVPKYGRAAAIVGGAGGPGVLLVKRGDTWSDPAFYSIGSINVGAQAGVKVGALALILNSDKAVNNFTEKNKFSIDGTAGLTIVNWDKNAAASAGRGDVVAWTDAKGLFGDIAVGVTDIRYDAKETAAYYDRKVAASDVINGAVRSPRADALKQALAAVAGGTSTGTSSTGTSTRHGKAGGKTDKSADKSGSESTSH